MLGDQFFANELAAQLTALCPATLMQIKRASGFPVYLMADARVSGDEAMAWWTPTNLAVLFFPKHPTSHNDVLRSLVSRL